MATGTTAESAAGANADRYQNYIEQQLDKTRTYVRTVDVAAAITTLLIGMFGVMLVAAIVDHWLVPGGLGAVGRWLFFLALAAGAIYYTVAYVLPLLVRRINPLYAARALEQSEPTLKNSLINFLMLRSNPAAVRAGVYRAVQSRAATDLTNVSVDTAVDRSHLIKLGYVLVGLLVAFAAYVFISPKSPLPSIGRVLAPWGDIDRPSRVRIEDVAQTPDEVFRGQYITVSALVHGLADDEDVTLYWSTADGQVSEEPIVMYTGEDDAKHRCTIPAKDENGLRQDISYWIAAGDTRTQRIDVTVLEELFITIEEVHYEYPDYTRKEPATQTHGDIRAVEGTTVTIIAVANRPIHEAHIDFDCDGTMDLLAERIDDHRAEFRFVLSLRGKDKQIENSTYWIRYFTDRDRENARPVKQRIEILPDWPPEVNIVEPQKERYEVSPGYRVPFRLRARDNDYGLEQVEIIVEHGPKRLATMPLLAKRDRPWVGESWLERSWTFLPSNYKLVPGDVMHVFAQVTDNRRPNGQKRQSRRKIEFTIIEPAKVADKDKPDLGNPEDKPKDTVVADKDKQPDPNDPMKGQTQEPAKGDQPPKDGEPEQDGMGDNGGMKEPGDGGMGGEPSGAQDKPMDGEKGMESGGMGGGESGAEGDPKFEDGMESGDGNPQGGGGQESNDPNAKPGEQQQPGEGGTGGGAPQERPINPNDDRDVIEEALRHRDEQQGSGGKGQPKPDGGEKSDGASGMNEPGTKGTKPKDGAQNPEQRPDGAAEGDGMKTGSDKPESDPSGMGTADDPGGKTGNPMGDDTKQPGGGGMKPDGDGMKDPMSQDGMGGSSGEQPMDKPGGSPMGDKAGGSGDMGSKDKKPGESAKETPTGMGDESQMSKGEGTGEQKNDGNVDQKKKGQGSQADDEGHGKRDGEGTAGSSTSKDEGAGKSSEEGMGETSDMAGDDKKADGETGKSDDSKKGDGSRRDGQGDKSGGKPTKDQGDKSPMDPGSEGGEPSDTPGDGSASKAGKKSDDGKPTSFGGDQTGKIDPNSKGGPEPPAGDEPEGPDTRGREHAKKTTELALDHLKEELAKSESDLLDKDGPLTREQAQQWVDRWEKILKDAKKSGRKNDAKKKLEQSLDNLGIRPERSTVGRGTARDQFRDVRRGTRSRPPAEFADQFRAYKKGTSQQGGK